MTEKELQAHILLLDDKNELVYANVRDSLLSQNDNILKQLEQALETSENELVRVRLEGIVDVIKSSIVKKEFETWLTNGGNDILEGANIICRQKYFDNDFAEENALIEEIKSNAWLEMHENLTALEKTKVINHILFNMYKFKGHKDYYNDFKSYYINNVTSSKKGSPVMLSVIYIAVAQKLDIPIFGVDLHNNFILAYVDKKSAEIAFDNSSDVLFYINPFNRGSIFGKNEIDQYLKQQNVEKKDKFYRASDNIVVIRRLIIELMRLAKSKNDNNQLESLRELYAISTKTDV